MSDSSTVTLDLRAVLAVAGLGIVVLVIIFVELCGREDVSESVQSPPTVLNPTPGQPFPTVTPGPSPTAGPTPTATVPRPEPGGGERDLARQADLVAIQEALEAYHDEHGAYPDNEKAVQSLCAFPDDVGCALEEFLDPIPQDPLVELGGSPSEDGYWYSSDGQTFRVYAQQETGILLDCPDHPDHLRKIQSLACIP